VLVWIGTVAALALAFAPPLAGLAALAAGLWLKFALVTRASFNQGFSLPHLPVRGGR
jgi:phenylacetyl-CoA:acceptor oxidoreductase subunit 2